MTRLFPRFRSAADRLLRRPTPARRTEACTWDQLRAVYEEQAARGVPEAVRGLELMDQGRWPSDGARRRRSS